MATAPMTRPLYMLGKWISNFAVLMLMVVILAVFGIVIQLLSGESTQINLSTYLLPFVFIVMPLMASSAALRFALDGDTIGLLALLSGALFIPSLALASGIWSGASKLFEILYMVIWYLGPLNKVPGLDFIGSHSNGYPQIFIPFSIALIAFAFFGRSRQLRN